MQLSKEKHELASFFFENKNLNDSVMSILLKKKKTDSRTLMEFCFLSSGNISQTFSQ